MIKMKMSFLVIIGSLLLVSCSGLKVTCDKDSTVDFTKYKSFEYYGWAEESSKVLTDFDRDRIEKAFGAEFKSRNLQYVKENGDLIVSLYIVVNKKTEQVANTTSSYGGYGYGGYYGYGPGYGYGTGYSTTTITEYDYREGTLVISVYDAKEKKLVWESTASKTIDEDPKGRTEKINYAVKQIMNKYPVKPIKQ